MNYYVIITPVTYIVLCINYPSIKIDLIANSKCKRNDGSRISLFGNHYREIKFLFESVKNKIS